MWWPRLLKIYKGLLVMTFRKKTAIFFLLLFLTLLAGFFWYKQDVLQGDSVKMNDAAKKTEIDSIVGMTDEDRIRKRSQERWNAVVENNFDKVFEYATPSYRKTYTKKHFFNQYGGQILRLKTETISIKLVAPDVAKVVTEIFFISGDFKGSSFSSDTWKKVDDKWWFIETK